MLVDNSEVKFLAISQGPLAISGGGPSLPVSLCLSEAASTGGLMVNIYTSAPTLSSVPATVLFAQSETCKSFTVTVVNDWNSVGETITITVISTGSTADCELVNDSADQSRLHCLAPHCFAKQL